MPAQCAYPYINAWQLVLCPLSFVGCGFNTAAEIILEIMAFLYVEKKIVMYFLLCQSNLRSFGKHSSEWTHTLLTPDNTHGIVIINTMTICKTGCHRKQASLASVITKRFSLWCMQSSLCKAVASKMNTLGKHTTEMYCNSI